MNWVRLLILLHALGEAWVVHAQDSPRNELFLAGEWFKLEALRVEGRTGANQSFNGWHPSSMGIQVNYTHWLGSQFGLGIGLGLKQVPFTYSWDRGRGVFYPAKFAPLGVEKEFKDNSTLVSLGMHLSMRVEIRRQWRAMGSLSMAVTQLASETSSFTSTERLETDSAIVVMRRVDKVNQSAKAIPLLRFTGDLGYVLPNMNTVSFGLVLQYSTRRDIFTGAYVLHPDSPYESTGRYRGGVSYLGVQIGYTMSWGMPKEPAWVRKARRRSEVVP